MSEQEVLIHTKSHGQSQGLASYLVEQTLKKRNYNIDNTSVIVVDLKKLLCMSREG